MTPTARDDNVLSYEVGEELVVYDRMAQRAHRLNAVAAVVWRLCDGQRGVEAIAREARCDEETVWVALKQLGHVRLL